MFFDSEKIKVAISSYDVFGVYDDPEINYQALLFACDCFTVSDIETVTKFLRVLKDSNHTSMQSKHLCSILLRHSTMLKKILFVNDPNFITIPFIRIGFSTSSESGTFTTNLNIHYLNDKQYKPVKDLSVRDTLKYFRDHYDRIIINTPVIFTTEYELESVADSILNPRPKLGLGGIISLL